MPRNDYECEIHGVREYYFERIQPRFCRDCGNELVFVVAPNQFKIGGEDVWLDEPTRRSIATQLGEYPESKEHLRKIEKKRGVSRTTKEEVKRAGTESVRW